MDDMDRLCVLLYLLLRESIPFGVIERALETIEGLHASDVDKHRFKNGNRDAYVRSLAARILLDARAQKAFLKRFNAPQRSPK
jgi:hypothetical protein